MKNLLLIITFIFSGIHITNAQEEAFNLTINISGLDSDKGILIVGVYNKKENF